MMAFTAKRTEAPVPELVIVAFSAVLVSLNKVCELSPLFLIAAVPAVAVLKNPTIAAGKGPDALLLIVEVPAVVVSKKLIPPVALALFSVALVALAVSVNSMSERKPLLVTVEEPAVDCP